MCERERERACMRVHRVLNVTAEGRAYTLKSPPLFLMHLSSKCGHTVQRNGGEDGDEGNAVRSHAADPVIGCVCGCVCMDMCVCGKESTYVDMTYLCCLLSI